MRHDIPPLEPQKNRAETFFEQYLEVSFVTTPDFVKRMQLKEPDLSEAEILEAQGYNFDESGKTVILIRNDAFPAEYLAYLATHEKWEAYMARKKGYNLYKKSQRKFLEDRQIENFDEKRKKEFFESLLDFRYEFRHEHAVYKEYEHALKEGKLDIYHTFFMERRAQKISQLKEQEIPPWMKNDTKIRESIYQKLTTGIAHHFIR